MQDKKKNFEKVSSNRKEIIIKYIQSFYNFQNTSFYEFSREDINKLFSDIRQTLDLEESILNQHLDHKERKSKNNESLSCY